MVAAAFKDVSFLGWFVSVLFISGDIAKESPSFLPGAACASGVGRGFLCKALGATAMPVQEHLAAEFFAWSDQILHLPARSCFK